MTKKPDVSLKILLAASLIVMAGIALSDTAAANPEQGHHAEQAALEGHAAAGDHTEGEHAEGGHAEGDHAEGGHAEGDHAADHDEYHLPNFVSIIFGEQLEGHETWLDPIFAAIGALIIVLVLTSVTTRRREDPGRLQVAVEMLLEGLDYMVASVIGPTGRRYTPFLGTLFLFIWINNLLGLVPLFHAATSAINITVALALCTFLYVQFTAFKENGLLGYLHHVAGSPKNGIEWAFVPLLFPLHLLGEFIKPLSLSLRLFGNVMGEDKLIAVFITLGAAMMAFSHLPLGIPIQVPIMFLALLTSTIQALVFTLLSTVYIALMLPHDDHGEAHGH